mmetsp:Transcript_50830/g.69167  ORF Transcript_50830/g.69167 Transcript_50830/m.69167 type:complete len:139 (-) Transcript_50830:171-587(-)
MASVREKLEIAELENRALREQIEVFEEVLTVHHEEKLERASCLVANDRPCDLEQTRQSNDVSRIQHFRRAEKRLAAGDGTNCFFDDDIEQWAERDLNQTGPLTLNEFPDQFLDSGHMTSESDSMDSLHVVTGSPIISL